MEPYWPITPLHLSSSLTPTPPNLPSLQLLVQGPVELWWPAGYGAQPLYNISATFRPSTCSACPCTASTGRSSVSSSDVSPWEEDPTTISEPPCLVLSGSGQHGGATSDGCSSAQRAIGFRTIKLVTDPLEKVIRGAWTEELGEDDISVCMRRVTTEGSGRMRGGPGIWGLKVLATPP